MEIVFDENVEKNIYGMNPIHENDVMNHFLSSNEQPIILTFIDADGLKHFITCETEKEVCEMIQCCIVEEGYTNGILYLNNKKFLLKETVALIPA